MSMIILATDLDRTLLPNGKDEYDNSLPEFFDIARKQGLALVYVTGRNMSLYGEVKVEYDLETPDYFIGDVGASVYKKSDEILMPDDGWTTYIKDQTPKWDRAVIHEKMSELGCVRLQEKERQNEFKLSYYINDVSKKDEVVVFGENAIDEFDIKANVIYSFDPMKNVGLVDILPSAATKVAALEFVRKNLDVSKEDVIYAGDSGNDILPLTFGYKSIVVKNAPDNIKKEVQRRVDELGLSKNLYIATGNEKRNGNYSSGILEGLEYFGIKTQK